MACQGSSHATIAVGWPSTDREAPTAIATPAASFYPAIAAGVADLDRWEAAQLQLAEPKLMDFLIPGLNLGLTWFGD